jgi:ABC-type branched-subunit amino acid transport system ATPase component
MAKTLGSTTTSSPFLTAKDLRLHPGGLTALSGVSSEILLGEILALIALGGAGKTSLINSVSGLYRRLSQ